MPQTDVTGLSNYFLLTVLVVAACLIVFWQLRELNILHRRLASPAGLSADAVEQIVSNRSFTLIAVSLCAIACIAIYDWKLNIAAKEYVLQEERGNALQAELTSAQVTLDAKNKENQSLQEQIALNSGTSATADQLNALKQRYEEIFVTQLLLNRCKQTQPTDYHILNSALMRDLASVNAPSRLQYDITTAARGTYQELYAAMDCESPDVVKLVPSYQTYITALRDQYTMP